MKKLLCMVMVIMMAFAVLTGCTAKTEPAATAADAAPAADATAAEEPATAAETIKVGILGPHTGDYAVYGLAVKNGAQLYIDQVNAAGGVNGKQIETIVYDNKGDSTEAITAFTRMVDEGITALIGDVLTGNTIAVVGEAYPINMPMITASATAAAVTYDADSDTVFTNVFRTCFIDPFQGEKMAQYAAEKLGATTAAIITQTGNDYSVGLADAFKAKCAELGITIVAEEGYSEGDVDFKSQLTNILAAAPDVVFCPNYYQDDGMIVTQAREIGLTSTFLGGDGWAGVAAYASAEDLEGSFYCSAYAPGSTDAVKAFEAAYTAAYGADTLNMFAATGYDAAMVLVAALAKAEESGAAPASDEYKQAILDGIKSEGPSVQGITSEAGYTFDEYNNPIKSAVIMTVTGGAEVFQETF
ncbi:MAG TPA: ABC transporter substrate-binding protein [Clostridia bacterium]|nr:ABC transporter substrate-binding protein [Clostridia bacterium]